MKTSFGLPNAQVFPAALVKCTSKEEAIANIRGVIQVYLATLEEDKLPIPHKFSDNP